MCRRATLCLTTCLGACLGVNRAQLKKLLGAWGSPSRSDESGSPSWTSASLAESAFPAASPANSLVPSWTNWFLSLCFRRCSRLTCALRRSVNSLSSTPRMRAQADVEPLSEKNRGGHCTDLSEERGEHVRLIWGSQPPPIPCWQQQLGVPCLSRGSPSSTSTSSKLRALYCSCSISPRKDNAIAEYLR